MFRKAVREFDFHYALADSDHQLSISSLSSLDPPSLKPSAFSLMESAFTDGLNAEELEALTASGSEMSDIFADFMEAAAEKDLRNREMPHFAIYFVTAIYVATFLIGMTGNLWVIINLLRTRLWSQQQPLNASQRSRMYIVILAMSDLLLLLTLPFSLIFLHLENWVLGSFLCHVHLAVDIFTKMFSVLILTAMSLERYFIVCTRWRQSMSNARTTVYPMVFAVLICVVIPMCVQLYYTETSVIVMDTRSSVPEHVQHSVCTNAMPDDIFGLFVPFTFISGFAGPLIIMALCYILLVRHVRAKVRRRRANWIVKIPLKNPRYMNELKKSIWRIAIYHFVCWAPFWMFTIWPLYFESEWFMYCRLFANVLPYINASGNWLLYAVLNNDVRKHIYNRMKWATFLFPSPTL